MAISYMEIPKTFHLGIIWPNQDLPSKFSNKVLGDIKWKHQHQTFRINFANNQITSTILHLKRLERP